MSAIARLNSDCFGAQGKKLDSSLDAGDNFFRVVESTTIIASQLAANPAPIVQTTQYFSITRTIICIGRCIPLIGSITSGAFWKGKWYHVILRIILAIGRFLSPIAWLHKVRAIDLGKHVTWIRLAIMSAFTAAGVTALFISLREYFSLTGDNARKRLPEFRKDLKPGETAVEKLAQAQREAKNAAIVEGLDLLTAPTENGALSFTSKPWIIADSGLKIIASIGRLAIM